MKKIAFILCMLALTAANAQNKNNCWYSSDYYFTNSKPGVKKVKNVEAYVCFNDHAVSMFTKETGLVTFTYTDIASGIDSSVNQAYWEGASGRYGTWEFGEYRIKMTYNHLIKIEKTMNGNWCVWLWSPCHTQHGCVEIAKKQTHKEWFPAVADPAKISRLAKFTEAKDVAAFDTSSTSFLKLFLKECDADTAVVILRDYNEMPIDTIRVSQAFPYIPFNMLTGAPKFYSVIGETTSHRYGVTSESYIRRN